MWRCRCRDGKGREWLASRPFFIRLWEATGLVNREKGRVLSLRVKGPPRAARRLVWRRRSRPSNTVQVDLARSLKSRSRLFTDEIFIHAHHRFPPIKGTNAGTVSLYCFHFGSSFNFLSVDFSSIGTPEMNRIREYSRTGEAAARKTIHGGYHAPVGTALPSGFVAAWRAERDKMY